MSSLGNIIKKEIKELITPATVLPIVFMAILFGSIGGTVSDIQEGSDEPPIIALINEKNTTFSNIAANVFYEKSEIIFNSTDINDKQNALEKLHEEDGMALIVIPGNFTENIENNTYGQIEVYWIMKGAGLLNSISSVSVQNILGEINYLISSKLVEQNNLHNASFVLYPTQRIQTTNYKGLDFKNASPNDITAILSTQSTMIPVLMMIIIIMSGQMVISSMALEKENKTLETLLTLPVKRTSIVTGKILSSAIVGLLLAFIYLLGFGYYMTSFDMGQIVSDTGIDLSLSMFDLSLFGILLFVTLIAALSLCMFLGTMAKNFKSAQSLIFPVVMMTMFPMFITMFTDVDILPVGFKALVYAIPFSYPMMATRALIFKDYLFVIGGIIYVTIFTLGMIALVVWVFRTDRLLTGTIQKKKLMEYRKSFFRR